MDEKKCQEPECAGVLDVNSFVILQAGGCAISSLAYPCNTCSRLHRWDGEQLVNARGQRLFRKVERGKVRIVAIDESNNPILAFAPAGEE